MVDITGCQTVVGESWNQGISELGEIQSWLKLYFTEEKMWNKWLSDFTKARQLVSVKTEASNIGC